MDEKEETRRVFIDLIKLISDKDEQIKYQKDVPIANVPAELVCMWFDDHYYPDSDWFKDAFSEQEQKAMERFNQFYKSRLKSLPDTNDIFDLQKSKVWDEIVQEAGEALRSFVVGGTADNNA